MRIFLYASKTYLILRSAPKGRVSKDATTCMQYSLKLSAVEVGG